MPQDNYHESRDRRSAHGERSAHPSGRSSRAEQDAPRRPRKRKRSAGRTAALVLLYVTAVIGISVLLACIGWMCAGDVLALNKEYKEVTFTVTTEEKFDDVADRLKDEGLIEYKLLFHIFASFTHGKEKVSPDTYILTTDMDYRALLSGMRANSANRAQVRVSIPEGYTNDQIFALLEENGVSTVEELREAAANHDYAFDFLQDIPLGGYRRLEGYLMPATYDFYTNHDPVYALNKLLVYFDSQVINDSMAAQVEASGYSLREILTIASMIERETTGEDRTDIASVIYNRLSNQDGGTMGFLQIDATLVYINGGKEPTEADKAIDSPYNTYLYKGLPAGPIANPGLESVVAALNPADSKNYYYALGDDDNHHFFRTYDQLQNFIASQERYQK